jgi:hypothetical protein
MDNNKLSRCDVLQSSNQPHCRFHDQVDRTEEDLLCWIAQKNKILLQKIEQQEQNY